MRSQFLSSLAQLIWNHKITINKYYRWLWSRKFREQQNILVWSLYFENTSLATTITLCGSNWCNWTICIAFGTFILNAPRYPPSLDKLYQHTLNSGELLPKWIDAKSHKNDFIFVNKLFFFCHGQSWTLTESQSAALRSFTTPTNSSSPPLPYCVVVVFFWATFLVERTDGGGRGERKDMDWNWAC